MIWNGQLCLHDFVSTRRLNAHYSVARYALRCAVPLALSRLWRLRLFHCTGRDLSNRLWTIGRAWLELHRVDRNRVYKIQKDPERSKTSVSGTNSGTNFKADRSYVAILPALISRSDSVCANSWWGEVFFLTARCWCWRRFYNPQKSNSRWDSSNDDAETWRVWKNVQDVLKSQSLSGRW